ncbi:2-C-methyl-D-erythritol 2,4-cyclodiphosphate synthase [Dysgonomonas sp. 521]|jgi:2-C-methyl-D-erythritol 2,4-cyclodiphosphate synthase|uniref:2-C-methyl-D-erythritol 2,4-cyclodiphosphate synthase n=1 Tax=Dysgonomonas sp. 521 TaxID=2302932 RepID=UPI0013D7C01A|nr:2-C-methyl-D-erythritol 2,4-cyclodiphosphate synthase [Dysgonomonas sp. 521]NDV94980.1 2-C-methyl-D-erythritol 2,4-cyclodiphosphate synthase [Dysgonomonas sp. 521]
MKIRVGFGYDVHRLADNRELWLGGVKIEHSQGLLGHSDADVLIHAVCDALLGAANLRDIGFHFPDTAGEYKDIDSKILLKKTLEVITEKGYKIGNIDATICAERPKINPHIPAMQKVMAEILQISVDDISIKATTSEKMGFVGREEGFASYAVALIEKE